MILAVLLVINATIGLANYSIVVNYTGLAPHFGFTASGYFYVLTPTNATYVNASSVSYVLWNSTYLLINPLSITNGSRLSVGYYGGKAKFLFIEIGQTFSEQEQRTIALPPPKLEEKSEMDPNVIEVVIALVFAASAIALVRALGRSRRRA